MRKPLDITVLVDLACVPVDDPEFLVPDADARTERHVVTALRELGHRVSIVGLHDRLEPLLATLRDRAPDMVFNLTEVFRADRHLDKNIAAVLELLDVPFSGTGATGLLLCRDKGLCKQLLSLHKIRVPGFVQFPVGKIARAPKWLRFPLVVKPALADGSEGIANASLVSGQESLAERARFVHDRWSQPAIAEEYVAGRELYVSVLGNRRLRVLPARELFFNAGGGEGPVMATYRVKWDRAYQEKWGIRFGNAEIDADLAAVVARVCRKVYRVLHLRDYARIDLRLTPERRVVVLEVNPNPDIAYGEEVAESAAQAGIPYNTLIDSILRSAWRRRTGHR